MNAAARSTSALPARIAKSIANPRVSFGLSLGTRPALRSTLRLAGNPVPGSMPELPPGFVEKHKKETATSDNPADFLTKNEYLELGKTIRAATLQALDRLSPEDLDKSVEGRLPPFVKRVGDCFTIIPNHWALHAGQWVILRRKLNR